MEKIKVLLVEDEESLALIIKDTLEANDFLIETARNGQEGLERFFENQPDVLVTDVMMPLLDGFEMVRLIRQQNLTTPVLFLTARSSINDVVQGFELGANDYLKKPFGIQELIVRIKALAGRAFQRPFPEKEEADRYTLGEYRFSPVLQRLEYRDKIISLTFREAEILKRLCQNQNRVVDMQPILLDLWGDDSFFNTRSLQVFITKLRHKLAKDNHIRIVNVRGIGYKLLIE